MKKEMRNYFLLTIGAIIQGLSMALFLFPHGVPSGGAAGIAILMNYWLYLPLGVSLWLTNFILLSFAIYWFGMLWTLRTMYSVTVTSFTVHIVDQYVYFSNELLWLDLIFGSFVFGVGVGILIRYGASSGGMVIPSLIISTLKNVPPGKVMFWINMTIFIVTATVIEWKIVFYAIFCQWFSTHVIDIVYKLNVRYLLSLIRNFLG